MFASKKASSDISSDLDVLDKVSRAIASDMYLEDILKILVAMTAQLMDAKISSLMLLTEKGDELRLAATQSLSEEYTKKPNVKVGQSISGRAVSERKPIAVLNVTRDPTYMYPDLAKKEKLVSMLAVPLIVKGKVIGVLNSYTSKPHEFTEREIKLVSAVANQAAVAIYNRKLLDENTSLENKLEERKMIERAKGMLMKQANISEEEAFARIRAQSMNSRLSMREIAEAILLTRELEK
jgi:signal transduction protein with GAF and PtsI domain